MTNDVEKRWSDRPTMRSAAWYASGVIALAFLAAGIIIVWALATSEAECVTAEFRVCASPDRYLLAFVPSGILFLGGIGAFVRTYTTWRKGGTWPIWQGAGWILFLLMLVYVFTSAGIL
ncbi:MAG: hypothetical protein GX610_21595 [Rhodococcus sp.]|nr:hypothetical protein [Rhodococcus sp. (in: high G+C Gram-positive bacteria)]